MEQSILIGTKQTLNIPADYDAFDYDIISHINAVFFQLAELGLGPAEGFMIEDETTTWSDFPIPISQLNAVRSLVFLKVRLLFDPPATSFGIDAMERQIKQFEWMLNAARENLIPIPVVDR